MYGLTDLFFCFPFPNLWKLLEWACACTHTQVCLAHAKVLILAGIWRKEKVLAHTTVTLTYWLCWFLTLGRWGSLTVVSVVHFWASRLPLVLWISDEVAGSVQKTPSSCWKSDKNYYLLLLQPSGREPFSPVCHETDLFRIPNLSDDQTSGSILKAITVDLVTQQKTLRDIWSVHFFKARARLFWSLLMVSSSVVPNTIKYTFACSH